MYWSLVEAWTILREVSAQANRDEGEEAGQGVGPPLAPEVVGRASLGLPPKRAGDSREVKVQQEQRFVLTNTIEPVEEQEEEEEEEKEDVAKEVPEDVVEAGEERALPDLIADTPYLCLPDLVKVREAGRVTRSDLGPEDAAAGGQDRPAARLKRRPREVYIETEGVRREVSSEESAWAELGRTLAQIAGSIEGGQGRRQEGERQEGERQEGGSRRRRRRRMTRRTSLPNMTGPGDGPASGERRMSLGSGRQQKYNKSSVRSRDIDSWRRTTEDMMEDKMEDKTVYVASNRGSTAASTLLRIVGYVSFYYCIKKVENILK